MKKNKKRGYFIIELCIYVTFLSLLTLILSKNLIFYFKILKENIKESKELNYIINAEMYLDNRFLDKRVEKLVVNDKHNFILIDFWEEDKRINDKIELKKNNLCVTYSRYGKYYVNSILDNVESFDVIDKKDLFYIKLKPKGMKERIYCYEK